MRRSLLNLGKKNREEAAKFVNAAYRGLLHREPENGIFENAIEKLINGLSPSEFIEAITKSSEYQGQIHAGYVQDFDHRKRDIKFIKSRISKKIRNIIYFIPGVNKPIGGVKIAAQLCEMINGLQNSDFIAKLFCPLVDSNPISWFDYCVEFKSDNIFDVSTDYVIIPELWAAYYGELFKKYDLSFGIFVQNGYYIFNSENPHNLSSLTSLREVYSTAAAIYTISVDAANCLELMIDADKNKIIRLQPAVSDEMFYPSVKKENIIAYMPRKLYQHSSWLISRLTLMQISNWQIVAIDKMSERQVANILGKSKIFLSFADQEGFVLPALEAALSGNLVIGYTGQAAKEYWEFPIFREVENGNLFLFVRKIEEAISELELMNNLVAECHRTQLKELKLRYSKENQINGIKKLLSRVSEI